MKKYSYIIIDNDAESVLKTRIVAEGFSELTFIASATNYQQGLNLVLEHRPYFIFLEIDAENSTSNLSLAFIGELYRFLSVIPKIIITTAKKELAFDAIQYGVFDYILKPLTHVDVVKTLLKLEKVLLEPKEPKSAVIESSANILEENVSEAKIMPLVEEEKQIVAEEEAPIVIQEVQLTQNPEKPLILCIKSYGDYRYMNAADICYFQADNNSTDIYLSSGEMVTAFKTLKHFESILVHPFIRIHNSYIINQNYISRIHNGNSVCYIKNSPKKVPFSKTYKANVDLIIANFSAGNYIEI
ncbi:LytTR family transcriptional regulator DNA-binding domain-containing protein [Flavobacterium sp. LHD-80]|uniref:LytR/AlgR family response regulator transcription factor n=1 Tax=Flavobacterium sp. LHD-80 TaxID=3071411 RepID=UPI0027DFAAAE|nr:LytTR family transcriptional regulator DNA-binding domain-containing protein [Flavobacterium sp. LHD-80]MDQ6471283.1 LytTR family transcriptional regulator DNA-binding domain-containing protein [Flavobacterium sp. LHD-80]